MNIKAIIPPPSAVIREGIIVLGGILIAALVISRIKTLQNFVQQSSITIKDDRGNILF